MDPRVIDLLNTAVWRPLTIAEASEGLRLEFQEALREMAYRDIAVDGLIGDWTDRTFPICGSHDHPDFPARREAVKAGTGILDME